MSTTTELEEEHTRLGREQGQLERKLTESRLQRPDTALVQAHWAAFLAIWEVASEEERGKLLPLIVERVELTEKERGFCRLVFQPELPRSRHFPTSGNVVVNSLIGAGTRLSSIYSPELLALGTVSFRFKALKGGRSRTKIPRPERQT